MEKIKRIISVLFFVFLVTNSAQAATFGEDLYVQIKPAFITEADLDKIKETGFGGVRFGIRWSQIERKKDHYSFDAPVHVNANGERSLSFDSLIEELRARNLKMLIVLFGGNEHYTGASQNYYKPQALLPNSKPRKLIPPPVTPNEVKEFSRFSVNTVSHYTEQYGSEPFYWIVWNEPNLWGFYPPKPSPQNFGELLYSTCTTIKERVPKAKVGGPGLATDPKTWWGTDLAFTISMLEKKNSLDCLDTITYHPYRPVNPETVIDTYTEIDNAIKSFQSKTRKTLIAVDEWGYSSYKKVLGQISPELQASYLSRIYLINHLTGIPFTNLYEWKDSGDDLNEREHNFGLIDSSGKPKPAFLMLENLLQELRGYTLVGQLMPNTCSDDIFIALFQHEQEQKIVVWGTKSLQTKVKTTSNKGKVNEYILNDESIVIIPFITSDSLSCY